MHELSGYLFYQKMLIAIRAWINNNMYCLIGIQLPNDVSFEIDSVITGLSHKL